MQKLFLILTFFFAKTSISFRRRPINLHWGIHLKYHHLILRCWTNWKQPNQYCLFPGHTLAWPAAPQASLISQQASLPGPPVLNFCECEPWRTWYRFHGDVTRDVYTIVGLKNIAPWKCILFSALKTQGPGSVYYFRDWKPKDLEVYTNLGTEPKTQGLGSVCCWLMAIGYWLVTIGYRLVAGWLVGWLVGWLLNWNARVFTGVICLIEMLLVCLWENVSCARVFALVLYA